MAVVVDASINEGTVVVDAKTLAADLAESFRVRATAATAGEILVLRDEVLRQQQEHKLVQSQFEQQLQEYEQRLQENEQQHNLLLLERVRTMLWIFRHLVADTIARRSNVSARLRRR